MADKMENFNRSFPGRMTLENFFHRHRFYVKRFATVDLLHIQIVAEQPEGRWKIHQTLFPLSQTSVDYIVLHPDQNVARFQLVMP